MKTVVITGANKGIGFATVKKFLEADWSVIATYRETSIPVEHASLVKVRLDLASSESITTTVEEIKKRGAIIDVLINNGGILLDNHDDGIDLQKVRKTFDVDLFGTIDFTERMMPLLSPHAHIGRFQSENERMVPRAGVEPARPYEHDILSVTCIAISPPGQ